jgi:two-component system phosphate regulon sensor histidine kinase PhoR
MQLKTIRIIAAVTILVLLGILFTQLYWVRHAVELREEQFNNKVRIALKTVVNHLYNYKAEKEVQDTSCFKACLLNDRHIYQLVDSVKLDSLVQNELGCMRITRDYEYAVFNRHSGQFYMGRYSNYKKELLSSEFVVSLSCLHRSDDFVLSLYFPNLQGVMIRKMIGWVVLTASLMLVLFAISFYTVYGLFRQKRLSEMKNDFVNNMTHEFKTPISAVSLASEILLRPEVNRKPEKVGRYAQLIYDENMRLKNQVENILQLAVLDRSDYNIKLKQLNAHDILTRQVHNFEIRLKERNGSISLDLQAQNPVIQADKVHLINVFNNLLDNAEKYSPENPAIKIETHNNKTGLFVSIQDNGIGISRENQSLVFRKLYRVPTGNVHDVKGFGIGLYYVKKIVEAHQGHIHLHSELNKGSRFEIFLPFSSGTA